MNAREAASLLNVNERTIRRAIDSGALAATKTGAGFCIEPADLERYRARKAKSGLSILSDITPIQQPQPKPRLLRSVPKPPPIPRPLHSLIGRDDVVEAVIGMINRDDVRLVTLTGPGGVGKTRLALQIVVELAASDGRDTWFVPLASVRDGNRVLDAIALAVQIGELGRRSVWDALVSSLFEREVVLVLDNFEQVMSAAEQIAELLQTCPLLKIVVTSRTLLRISGERAIPVPTFAVPSTDDDVSLNDLSQSAAVRLFVERATAVSPSFALSPSTVPIVADICRRVDGLPLAIELAAARASFLPVATIRDRLKQRLPFLVGGARDAPPRHQTMRNAITWSYELLSDAEQTLFRWLGLFVGGFSLEAVEAVWQGGDGLPGWSAAHGANATAADCLGSLVDSSLVHRTSSDEEDPRFGMLETIRAFALELLQTSPDETLASNRHAEWCLRLVDSLGAGDSVWLVDLLWLPALEREQGNILGALSWLEHIGDGDQMLKLSVGTRPYWEVRGYHQQGIDWLTRALAMSGPNVSDYRLRAERGLVRHFLRLGRYEEALIAGHRVLALARDLRDDQEIGRALHALGCIQANRECYQAAADLLEDALAIFRAYDDRSSICAAHYFLSVVRYGQGDSARAREHIDAALLLRRAEGPIYHQFLLLNVFGLLCCELGEIGAAVDALIESHAAWQQGAGTNREVLAEWLASVSRLELACGRPESATTYLGAADALTEDVGVPLVVPPPSQHRRLLSTLRTQLGPGTFATLWDAGRAFSVDQMLGDALQRLMTFQQTEPSVALLTRREHEVLELLAVGQTDRDIATTLSISVRTVEGHVSRIRDKLGVQTRTAVVSSAIAMGLYHPNDSPRAMS